MKRYVITHETHYSYGAAVDLGLHVLRMTPLALPRQRVLDHRLSVSPDPTRLTGFIDHFGNQMHHLSIETAHEELRVVVTAEVMVEAPAATPVPEGPAWDSVRDAMRNDGFASPPEVAEFVGASPLAPIDQDATEYARVSFPPQRAIVAGARDYLQRMRADFTYAPGTTEISTPISEVMQTRAGVCQDFAHIMIAGLRGLGLPARYVSGYLRTYTQQSDQGLRGADATHAWVSVWCGDELGWVDLDPTNNLIVGDEHISLAYGRDFSDVTPLRGVIRGGGQHTLAVAVTVEQVER